MNHYDLLGVPPSATAEQIRAAYRTLAQIFHPDRLTHLKPEARTFAEDRLKALNQAYEVLGDAARRTRYDAALREAPGPARAGYHPAAPTPAPPHRSGQPPSGAPSVAASRRAAALERRRRLGQIDAEIADLTRNIANLEYERERHAVISRRLQSRIGWRFGLSTALTGIGFWSILLASIRIFSQPAATLNANAQRVAFVLLVMVYEYLSALTIAVVCRQPKVRVSFWGTARVTARGLVFAWMVGLAAWAMWALIFGALSSMVALMSLALVFALAHVTFCWMALGHLTLLPREQQRQFNHAYAPMLQAYQHQLMQLRAQKAVIESETT